MGPQYANRLGDLLEDVMNGNQVWFRVGTPSLCVGAEEMNCWLERFVMWKPHMQQQSVQ